ncbi:hypothetical protein YC2023_115825 [Brassica napus]
MLTLLEIREPKYDRESSTKELRGGEGMLWFPLHNDKRIDKFLSFKRNRWQRPQAEKEVQNHLGCGEKSLEEREGLNTAEEEVEVRLSFTHVVDQIASVSVHQLQVDVVVVTLEAFMVMLRCW